MFRNLPTTLRHSLLALALSVAPLAADDQPGLDKSLDLDLAGAAAADVLSSMASVLGAELELDPAVRGDVVIKLKQVSARTTLDALCDMLDCAWDLDGDRLVVKSRAAAKEAEARRGDLDTPVALSLAGASVRHVLESFAGIGGWKLDYGEPEITIELQDVPVREALTEVCVQAGCVWTLDAVGDGGVLRIEWLE